MYKIFLSALVGLFLLLPQYGVATSASVSASPSSVYTGGAVTVTWSSSGTIQCTGSGFSTGNATSGSTTVYPSAGTKTYSITCYVSSPSCSLVLQNSYVDDGSWGNTCSEITLSNGSCAPSGAGCVSSAPRGGGTYTINDYECTGACSTISATSNSVVVSDPPPPPTPSVTLTANPTTVTAGSATLISWTSTRATSCDGTNFGTGGNTSGSVSVTPTANTTYSITCDSEVYSSTPGVWVDTGISDVTDCWCTSGPPPPNYSNLYIGDPCPSSNPAGTACVGSDVCYVNSWSGGGGPNTYCNLISDVYRCNGGSAPNQITSSASVLYNQTPNAPTITAPSTGVMNTNYTFSFRASDPDENTVRYRIDWNNDGTVDANLPSSGYTASNTLLSLLYQWASPGSYTVRARTQDSLGAQSGWTNHVIAISNPAPQCSDGADNDGDGAADYGNDPGCSSSSDTTESPNPQCSDGVDNDSDGRVDGDDYGCTDAGDGTETPNPQCSDGLDNNDNGLVDTLDLGACAGPTDGNEEFLDPGSVSLDAVELVRSGSYANLFWSGDNIQSDSCVLAGTNGDSWDLTGTSGTQPSNTLTREVVYTLTCLGLDGLSASDSETIRIVPRYREF